MYMSLCHVFKDRKPLVKNPSDMDMVVKNLQSRFDEEMITKENYKEEDAAELLKMQAKMLPAGI